MLFGIRKRNELLKPNGNKAKKSVSEEQPTIAATNAELYKSGLVAQNALRWEKARVENVAGQLGQLVPVGASWGQFNFKIHDSQASWRHLGPLRASSI